MLNSGKRHSCNMGNSSSAGKNSFVEIKKKNGNVNLSAKRTSPDPRVLVHTLTIDDRIVQVTEMEHGNGLSRKLLWTSLDTVEQIDKFKADWKSYWKPTTTTDYTSLDHFFSFTIATLPCWNAQTFVMVTERAEDHILIHKKFYQVLHFIDFGGFSEVYKAKEKKTGRVVAIKKVFLDNDINGLNLKDEINLLKTLENPRIVRLYDFQEVETGCWFEVLELGDTDLWNFLRSHEKRLSDKEIKDLWKQMLQVFFCH